MLNSKPFNKAPEFNYTYPPLISITALESGIIGMDPHNLYLNDFSSLLKESELPFEFSELNCQEQVAQWIKIHNTFSSLPMNARNLN